MVRKRGGDTPEAKRRRMPYVAKIKREDPFKPFKPEDRREIEAACRRVAGAAEFHSSAGWREDDGYLVFHFTTWAKARAMQHWIDRTGIARRPMPKLGETREEAAEARRAGLAWAFNTGAVAPIVQAFVRRRAAGDEELTSFNAACDVAKLLGRPGGEVQRTVRVLLEWAREHRPEWFAASEQAVRAAAKAHAPPRPARPAQPLEPLPSVWRPRF